LAPLAKFGATLANLTKQDFIARDNVVQIGVTPRRIDILTQITGVSYEEADAQTVTIEIEGIRFP